jgi:hypothetical protein
MATCIFYFGLASHLVALKILTTFSIKNKNDDEYKKKYKKSMICNFESLLRNLESKQKYTIFSRLPI